eukprot:SAG31_NODE_1644_length_7652_cov_2.702502_3_plen_148_part_00
MRIDVTAATNNSQSPLQTHMMSKIHVSVCNLSTLCATGAFRDLGAVWQKMGKAHGRVDIVANGTALQKEAELLHIDLINSMKASQVVDNSSLVKTCNPYIAGFDSCGTSPSTMKPGFVYPTLDIFYANWVSWFLLLGCIDRSSPTAR